MAASTDPQAPAAGTNGTAPGTVRATKRNRNYPLQLKINISHEMYAALKRYCRYWGLEEGVAARLILRQSFLQTDQQFRQSVEADDG
jgi:hypothetical protein